MKYVLSFMLTFLCLSAVYAQEGNPNTMTVMVDDKEYTTEPHRIKIGAYRYITGNSINPDISLRIWMGDFEGHFINEPGKYLIIGENENKKRNDSLYAASRTGEYKGIAHIKYVEETKSPRMEYHVGKSVFTGDYIEVKSVEDGFLDITFDLTLEGSVWKEKTSATTFGGLGRLKNKLSNKAVTGATGFEQNIDPEGAGYKKLKVEDTIKLSNGFVRIKIE